VTRFSTTDGRRPTAAEYYLDPDNHDHFEENNHNRGKSLLDHHMEDDLVRHLFAQYVTGRQDVLEIGSYTGRITRKLAAYTNRITVSDVSAGLLEKFTYPKFVLDLRTSPEDFDHPRCYDAIVSIGHQVSLSCDISNALALFNRLLNPSGVLIFDVWNAALPDRYDPPYPIQKATRSTVEDLLQFHGFTANECRPLSRLPYAFPKLFSRLFGRKRDPRLFRVLTGLETRIRRHDLFAGREHTFVFIATRTDGLPPRIGLSQ